MRQQVGQIIEFNGYGGKINSNSQEYLLLNNNIVEKEMELKVGDEVEFIPETINETPIARFIKKRKIKK